MTEPSNPKKNSLPQWQRAATGETREQSSPEAEDPTKVEPPPSRPALLEQAAKFLEEDGVRDAPTERTVAFLKSKGLNSGDIQKILSEAQQPGAQAETTESSSSSSVSPSNTSSTSPSSSSTPSSTPPIITYPEFLHPHPPPSSPPLITTSQLLSTFYLFSSLSLTIYGASKYIVTPMLTNLTSARHELATSTLTNISTLNEKLSTLVSEIPSSVTSPHSKSKDGKEGDEDSDAETETSDPNELFHRDYGTQTSPSLSRHPSLSVTSSTSSPQPPPTPLTAQESRLSTIRSHLSELLSDHTSQLSTSEEVSTRVQDLRTYLDGLHYSSSYYSSAGIYGGAIGGAGLGGVGATAGGGEDMVAKLKAEIRGVKGVLLSARNFPGGGGRVVGRVGD